MMMFFKRFPNVIDYLLCGLFGWHWILISVLLSHQFTQFQQSFADGTFF